MVRDVGGYELIKAVFHYDWDDIPPTPYGAGDAYTLSSSDVRSIIESPKEVEVYKHIAHASNALLKQVYGHAGPGPDPECAKERREEIIERRIERLGSDGNEPVRMYPGFVGPRATEAISKYLKEKPDMVYELKDINKSNFEWAPVPIEVERTKKLSAGQLSDVLVKAEDGIFIVLVCRFFVTSSRVSTRR